MTVSKFLACMGGRCELREDCGRYTQALGRANPCERICDRGTDGFKDGRPIELVEIRIKRAVGTWERRAVSGLLRPATPFDGLGELA